MHAPFVRRHLPYRLSIPHPSLRRISTSHVRKNNEPPSDADQTQHQPQQPRQNPPPPPPRQNENSTNHSPPLIYPPPPSAHHNDLSSFLAHAARTNLDPSSTVYVGTHFEYTAQRALARYGLALRRVGGVSDCGIDLLGTWALPFPATAGADPSRPLRVLAQCKAVQRAGPHLVRELEGAFVGAPVGWRGRGGGLGEHSNLGGGGGGVVGLLVTQKPATKGIREALARSGWPMGFVACSREGEVSQFLWNRRAEEEGLEGFGVGVKYVNGGDASGGKQELVLMWKGECVPFVGGGGKE